MDLATIGEWYRGWDDVREEDVTRLMQLVSQRQLSVVAGGALARFEKAYSRFAGATYTVAMNNGTAALHAALWAVGVRRDSDVLMCTYGYHGMAAAVLALGARVVPVDCLPTTLAVDPDDLKQAMTPQTSAVLVHNPWGVPADLEAVRAACGDVPVVLDASHAHGATHKGKPLAAWADITAYSLGPGKLVTGGELGCAVTDDPELRDRLLIFGHVNRVPRDLLGDSWVGNAVGLKFRPHPFAMALAQGQLKRFDEKKAMLLETCRRLEALFMPHGFLRQDSTNSERVYWRIVLRLDSEHFCGVPTSAIETCLRDSGLPVEENRYVPLLHEHPIFRWPDHVGFLFRRRCPVAEAVVPRTITLPAPVRLSEESLVQAGSAAEKAGHLGADRSGSTARALGI